jgi:hypothetical protein
MDSSYMQKKICQGLILSYTNPVYQEDHREHALQ